MATRQQTTAVDIFTDKAQADRALEALHNAGFSDDQIGFIRRDLRDTETGRVATDATETEATTEEKSAAAATGAVGGGILGGLLGAAAALVIPGIGPAVAGGILVTTLGGAAIGAVAGGLIGALTNMGIPEEEARYYQQELAAGRTLLTVNAGSRYNEALALLRSHGAYDVYTQPGTQQPITNTYETRAEDEARYAPSEPAKYNNQTYPAHHIEQSADAVGARTENYHNNAYSPEGENFQPGTSQSYHEQESSGQQTYRQDRNYNRIENTGIAPETYQRGVDTSNQPYTDNTNESIRTSAGMYNKDVPPTADSYSSDQAYSDGTMPPREDYPYQEQAGNMEANPRPLENQSEDQPTRHELKPDEYHKGNTPPPPNYRR